MVERGKLTKAAQCLERAAALAPQQDYVHRHLAIVRSRISRLPKEELAAADAAWDGGEEHYDDEALFGGGAGGDTLWQQANVQETTKETAEVEEDNEEVGESSVFLNHAVVHNHLGNKQQQQLQQQQQSSSAGAGEARLNMNLKSEWKSLRVYWRWSCLGIKIQLFYACFMLESIIRSSSIMILTESTLEYY